MNKLNVVFIVIFFVRNYANCHEYNPNGWDLAAEYILDYLDPKEDPCNNFYKFVCGGQLNKTDEAEENGGQASTSSKDVSYVKVFLQQSIPRINNSSPKYAQWLKIFYQKCIESQYTEPDKLLKDISLNMKKHFLPSIADVLSGLENNDPEAFWKFLGYLQREQNMPFLIYASVAVTEVNCVKRPLLHVVPFTFLPDMNVTYFGRILLKQIFELKTLAEEDINDTVSSMAQYYDDLTDINTRYTTGDLEPSQIKVNLSQLEAEHPYVKWRSYFRGLLPKDLHDSWINSEPYVVINDKEYFAQLENLHKRYDVLIRVNFAYTYFIYYLFDAFNQKAEYVRTAEDKKDAQDTVCLDMITTYFGPAAAVVMLNATEAKNVEEWKYDIEIMNEAILSAFRFMVDGLEWIDNEDKMKLMSKINAISVQTGIPNWLKNELDIEHRTAQYDPELSLLQNDLVGQKRLFLEQIQPLFGSKMLEDLAPNFDHKVQYNQFTINVPFGFIISPLYIYTDPLSLKFGALGWAVSRELLRAFDEVHIVEKPEDLESWLKNETLDEFQTKRNCLFDQYSKYCESESKDGQCKNQRALKEIILNGEALKVAFSAYKFTTQALGREPPLPKLVKYNSDQIFLISAGQSFCTNYGKEKDALTDVSAEDKIKLTIQKSPIFAKVFKCPAEKSAKPEECDTFTV